MPYTIQLFNHSNCKILIILISKKILNKTKFSTNGKKSDTLSPSISGRCPRTFFFFSCFGYATKNFSSFLWNC